MKIAQYRNVDHGFTSVFEVEKHWETHKEYVRISEPVEVEFVMLKPLTDELILKRKIQLAKDKAAKAQANLEALEATA